MRIGRRPGADRHQVSHVNGATAPKNLAAERFKQLAEERTKGRVKVEIYPNSQLYKDAEEIEALQTGSVQMLAPTLGKFGPLGIRQFEVFDLPYMFDNFDEVHRVTQGAIGKQLFAMLESKGIKGLAYWDNGFKQMNANKALRNVADFKGIKMRVFSSKVLDAEMRALGAIPQTLPASEIYLSMQTGLVDGGEDTTTTFNDFKFYEVQKYLRCRITATSATPWSSTRSSGTACRRPPDDPRRRDGGGDDLRQRHRRRAERLRAGGDPQDGQDPGDHAHRRREKGVEEGAPARASGNGTEDRQELITSIYKETGFDPGKL